MTKVTDLEANLEQFKIEQAAIKSEAAKQLALLQATIDRNKVEADRQFAEIMNAFKALQPPTTLPAIIPRFEENSGQQDLGQKLIDDLDEPLLVLESCGMKNMYEFAVVLIKQNQAEHHKMFIWYIILKLGYEICLGHLLTNVRLKQEPVPTQRRTWDPGITHGDYLKQHLEDKVVDEDEDRGFLVIDSDIDGSESDNNQCEGECYRYHKYRFKRDEFVKKDGYKHPDVLRAKPPGKMPIDEWNRNINFFLQPDQMKKSKTNSKNRSKLPYPSVQGTRTNAASRYLHRKVGTYGNPDEYPSLVSDFGLNHISQSYGTYVNEAAATKHKELQDALKSSQESEENVPEKEVVKKVLGTRSGHTRGVGRKLKGVSISSSATSSSSSYYGGSKAYTQDEVNDLIETEGKKLGKKIGKRIASSFNKKLENLLTQLADKGIPLDKTPLVGEEDEEYEESDDEEMEVLDEDDEINDGS
ncbi:hypothetical protein Tco_0496968 [Tanacetum coccineum]